MISYTCPIVLFLALSCFTNSFKFLLPHRRGPNKLFTAPPIDTSTKRNLDQPREEIKSQLLELLSATPSNQPTFKSLTNEILNVVRQLESNCPTPDNEVIGRLAGNWELLWTAQDQMSDEWGLGPLRTWIKYVFQHV